GDYDLQGDEKTIRYYYYPNPGAYITGKPAEIATFTGTTTSGSLLTETLYYYDGHGTWDQAPTIGKATRTAQWLSTSDSFVATEVEYDGYGNVVADIDALGNRTSYTIDETYHLFAIATTNALGQVVTKDWDPVCGHPRHTVNLNQQTTTIEHDALCRITRTL